MISSYGLCLLRFQIKVAFVGNLPKNADEGYLKKIFQPYGKVNYFFPSLWTFKVAYCD